MSDAYATRRFHEALRSFQALEAPLREGYGRGVDARRIDAVLIDLEAALPGLDGEERGRALMFKGYVLHWRHIVDWSGKSVFEAMEAPPDPRIEQAVESLRQGRVLLQDPDDISRADDLMKRLEAERQQ
jgi:hypothetical protein